jgi:hypothetical protein
MLYISLPSPLLCQTCKLHRTQLVLEAGIGQAAGVQDPRGASGILIVILSTTLSVLLGIEG